MARKRHKHKFYVWRLRKNTLYRCTLPEAAERLGYTMEGARLRLRRGRLRGYKAGGTWYIMMPGFDRR